MVLGKTTNCSYIYYVIKRETIMKVQTRKVGVAGGFINQMMGNNSTLPIVGEGATILMYSDRHAYEVIEVNGDRSKCVIREMDYQFVGDNYGDERYTYSSNEKNNTKTIEWNEKKQCWGHAYNTIEIQKSLVTKLSKEYGYGWENFLPNGLKYDDLFDKVHVDNYYNKMKVIEGITKEYKNFSKISIIFGLMERYQDPSF